MFKFIRKKILEGFIKDIVSELPEIKQGALALLQQKKDLVIEKVKEAIKQKIIELVEKN